MILKRIAKRTLDIVLSSFFLFFIGPLMVAIAILIKINDPRGKVFYKHYRVGKHGKSFACLKFRTMVKDADKILKELLEKDGNAKTEFENTFKLKNDPRIIPFIGTFLRKSSFDEFPQLFNIIKGDMSLVGPRPVADFGKEIEKYGDKKDLLFTVKPGLTGLWQISGRSDLNYEERVHLDMCYIKNQSLVLDLKIIALTFYTLFSRKGAY